MLLMNFTEDVLRNLLDDCSSNSTKDFNKKDMKGCWNP